MKRLPSLSSNLAAAIAIVGGFTLLPIVLVGADEPESAVKPETTAETVERSPEPSPAHAAQTAVELLRSSRDELLLRRSVSARLQQKVAIGGTNFQASGTYVSGEFPKLRLSFEVQVGNTTGSLLEVCDRQLLWTVQEIRHGAGGEPTVRASRTVIDELLSAIEDSRDVPEAVLIANLGMGGLPTLLASLERSMTFDAHKVSEYDGQPYAVIQGRWNDDFRARLGGGKGKPLPEYVPDHVWIYFDQKTKFPTRILYVKDAPKDSKLKTRHVLLSLEFSDVVLDGPVDEGQFRYVPPEGTQFENRTVRFLEMIKSAKEKAATIGATP